MIVFREGEGIAVVEVSTRMLARFVELEIPGKDVIFSDNSFDVLPGRTVSVTASLPDGRTVEEVVRALVTRSLYDSFS